MTNPAPPPYKRPSLADRLTYTTNPTAKKILECIVAKRSNLSVALDVTCSDALLDLAHLLGPSICVLKTHIDILEDFTPDLCTQLQALAKQHHFLIFEDRKFADIGNTVKLQYEKGIYKIAQWAPITNAHSLPGPGIIEGLKTVGLARGNGLLLLAEMSAANHLMNADYQQKTVEMAQKNKDFVIGFVAQRRLCADPAFIYFTPGVQMGSQGDALGQQYVTPEKAITENQTDIIIVGRGIYQAKDPAARAKEYRELAWDLSLFTARR